jgi:endonuclease YncB( thermonuclease family)
VEVRLLYVDCYETYYSERLTKQAERNNISLDSALKLGLEAKRFVKDLIEGKNIELIRIDDEPDKDVYGRLLRVVRYEGSRLDSILLKNGLAFEYEPF